MSIAEGICRELVDALFAEGSRPSLCLLMDEPGIAAFIAERVKEKGVEVVSHRVSSAEALSPILASLREATAVVELDELGPAEAKLILDRNARVADPATHGRLIVISRRWSLGHFDRTELMNGRSRSHVYRHRRERLLRVSDKGVDEWTCQRERFELVMELRLAGKKGARTTRKDFLAKIAGSSPVPASQIFFGDKEWDMTGIYDDLVNLKVSDGFCELGDGRTARRYDRVFVGRLPLDVGARFDVHPDGHTIVFATRGEDNGVAGRIQALDLRTGRSEVIHDHVSDGSIHDCLVFHPSGAAVYYAVGNRVFKLDLREKKAAAVYTFPRAWRIELEMSASGRALLAFGEGTSAMLSTDEDRVLRESKIERAVRATLSRSERLLASVARNAPQTDAVTLFVDDVTTGARLVERAFTHGAGILHFLSNDTQILLGARVYDLDELPRGAEPRFVFTTPKRGFDEDGVEPRGDFASSLSPDGKTLVFGAHRGHEPDVFSVGDFRLVAHLQTIAKRPSNVYPRFSRNGQVIAAVSQGAVTVWKAVDEPIPFSVPEVTPVVAKTSRAKSKAAIKVASADVLREWDALFESQRFPWGVGFFGNTFDDWDGRLDVYAKKDGEGLRYVVFFQVFGRHNGALNPYRNSLYIVHGPLGAPEHDMADISMTFPRRTSEGKFVVRIDDEPYELAPSIADDDVSEEALAELSSHLLADRIFVGDAPRHAKLAKFFASDGGSDRETPFTRVYSETGTDFLPHASGDGPLVLPSASPRWQKIAKLLTARRR